MPESKSLNIVLISTYELGRQPFGIASPAAWLKKAGHAVRTFDLAVASLDDQVVADADMICFYLPMHTATRLAVQLLPRVRKLNPDAHLCFYGLYAPMNDALLRKLGADSVIGAEFEAAIVQVADQLGKPNQPVIRDTIISFARLPFVIPDRTDLPPLREYSYLTLPNGSRRITGYTEATRGCKHLCRHCPVVPVYGGQFRVVPVDVVLADIAQQVEMGAEHITFGDPDFFNGPGHAMRVVTGMHDRWPHLTYDVTIKIEHLVQHPTRLDTLASTGCVLLTSAVESVDQTILERLDKRHTPAQFRQVVADCLRANLAFNPTFVTFTPWTTRAGYLELLDEIEELDLIGNVAPIQYAIRLLIPHGSRLLELEETRALVEPYDEMALAYPWHHPDPAMDKLHQQVLQIVLTSSDKGLSRAAIYEQVRQAAEGIANPSNGKVRRIDSRRFAPSGPIVPFLSEPWYC